jgi:RNA polymerase sigma factor (sigma-70 family)
MATSTVNGVLRHLRQVALLRDGGGLTDGQLLEHFLARRDETVFEALVRRHGPMVFGVCRRLLANEQDAEDAFQATFLVLACKAASIVPRELVGNWLYGVACRTALKAKATAAQRRVMERQVKAMPEPLTEPEVLWHDLQALLDQELQRLPEKYRLPVVLCDLEGRSRKQVAGQLGIPEGTLSSRLATARKRLAQRLARHGLALATGYLALALSQNAMSACVPPSLVGPTVTAATRFAAGQATAGLVSAKVAALAGAVLKTLWMTRLTVATVVLLALGMIGAGAGIVSTRTAAAERDNHERALAQVLDTPRVPGRHPVDQQEGPVNHKVEGLHKQQEDEQKNARDDGPQQHRDDGPKPKEEDDDDDDDQKCQGVVKALDVSQHTLTLTVRRKGKERDQTFDVKTNVPVQLARKSIAFCDVRAGMQVVLKLSRDRKTVVEIKETKGQQDEGPRSSKNAGKSKSGK